MDPRSSNGSSLRIALLDHLPFAIFVAGWLLLTTSSVAHLLRPIPFEVTATPAASLVARPAAGPTT